MSWTIYKTLILDAAFQRKSREVSTNTTLDNTYDVVKVTASATITLPTAVGVTGRCYVIDNAHTSSITVDTTSSQTIEGELTQSIPSNCCMQIYSDGSNWRIM